ncbi:MAG TPA: cytochrome P450, partial [Myxococcota bacterium]|nr:cytochrome P450 [Myxococcota bacterium]
MSASASTPQIDPSRLDVISSGHYEENGYPFREWAWLRRHDPVRWIEHPDYEPFWAIVKHADVTQLSTQPRLFLNAPRLAAFNKTAPPPPENESRHLLNMDPPDHGRYRNVSSKQFTPRAVRALEEKVRRITREILDEAAARNSGDFVRDISAPITIAVIAEMLGVPASDRALLFRWTNEVIAPEDPEYQREGSIEKTVEGARIELFQYFDAMSRDRRAKPREDIVSVVANGQVEGNPLNPVELLSYYLLLVVAGNETTRNAMTGGLITFLEHPGEWRKLQRDAALIDP